MKPMKLYNSIQELQEDQEKATEMPLRSQRVYPGRLPGHSDAETEFLPQKCHRQSDGECAENKLSSDAGNEKKQKRQEKQSLYSAITEALLQRYRFIRDELYNLYYYSNGFYNKADEISFAEFIKCKLEDAYIRRIPEPGFYRKLLTDMKSDYRIEQINRKKPDSRTKHRIAFKNGIFDSKHRKFLDFSPDIPIFSKLEVEYVEYPETPNFDRFLDSVSDGDEAVKDLIWEMIAYILLPSNDGKCFFMMGTAPNSGKSLLAKIIEAMIPDSEVNRSPISSISGRFGLASMAGKRINIAPECVDERISPEVVNNIKLLTGEDSVNIERKGIDATRESIACKLLIATNCATAFAVKDPAFWNRMRIVPFLHSIPQEEQRPDLFEKIKHELDDIATIAVSCFLGPLIESNYQFTVPDAAARLMCQWRNSSIDNLREFMECKCEVTHDPSDFISVRELYEKYCHWLNQSYCYATPLAIGDFSCKIRKNITQCTGQRKKEKIDGIYVRVLHGVCWPDEYDAR